MQLTIVENQRHGQVREVVHSGWREDVRLNEAVQCLRGIAHQTPVQRHSVKKQPRGIVSGHGQARGKHRSNQSSIIACNETNFISVSATLVDLTFAIRVSRVFLEEQTGQDGFQDGLRAIQGQISIGLGQNVIDQRTVLGVVHLLADGQRTDRLHRCWIRFFQLLEKARVQHDILRLR